MKTNVTRLISVDDNKVCKEWRDISMNVELSEDFMHRYEDQSTGKKYAYTKHYLKSLYVDTSMMFIGEKYLNIRHYLKDMEEYEDVLDWHILCRFCLKTSSKEWRITSTYTELIKIYDLLRFAGI